MTSCRLGRLDRLAVAANFADEQTLCIFNFRAQMQPYYLELRRLLRECCLQFLNGQRIGILRSTNNLEQATQSQSFRGFS